MLMQKLRTTRFRPPQIVSYFPGDSVYRDHYGAEVSLPAVRLPGVSLPSDGDAGGRPLATVHLLGGRDGTHKLPMRFTWAIAAGVGFIKPILVEVFGQSNEVRIFISESVFGYSRGSFYVLKVVSELLVVEKLKVGMLQRLKNTDTDHGKTSWWSGERGGCIWIHY